MNVWLSYNIQQVQQVQISTEFYVKMDSIAKNLADMRASMEVCIEAIRSSMEAMRCSIEALMEVIRGGDPSEWSDWRRSVDRYMSAMASKLESVEFNGTSDIQVD